MLQGFISYELDDQGRDLCGSHHHGNLDILQESHKYFIQYPNNIPNLDSCHMQEE